MNTRTPKMRQHKTGVWFCHWGARDHYFTKNKSESQQRYLKSLKQWAEWRADRNTRRLPPITHARLLVDIAEEFLEAKALERGEGAREYYRKHIKRFLLAYGSIRSDLLKPQHLRGLKEDLFRKGYAAKTVNHDIGAVKTLLRWAINFLEIQAIPLDGITKVALDPPPDKTLSPETVRTMVKNAPDTMKPWLALNYLCLMWLSEVIRVAHKQGDWVEEGIYEIENKVGRRTGMRRRVVFSPAALVWFDEIVPRWSRLDSYSQAVRDFFGRGGPGRLRHSAASHLHRSGVVRGDVDLLLVPRHSLILGCDFRKSFVQANLKKQLPHFLAVTQQ